MRGAEWAHTNDEKAAYHKLAARLWRRMLHLFAPSVDTIMLMCGGKIIKTLTELDALDDDKTQHDVSSERESDGQRPPFRSRRARAHTPHDTRAHDSRARDTRTHLARPCTGRSSTSRPAPCTFSTAERCGPSVSTTAKSLPRPRCCARTRATSGCPSRTASAPTRTRSWASFWLTPTRTRSCTTRRAATKTALYGRTAWWRCSAAGPAWSSSPSAAQPSRQGGSCY